MKECKVCKRLSKLGQKLEIAELYGEKFGYVRLHQYEEI